MAKDWKTAAPKWAVEAATAEMASMRHALALRWPTEAKTIALFGFGAYDKTWGDMKFGTFYVVNGRGVDKIMIRRKQEDESGWKSIRFSSDGERWTDGVHRGHYFETEHEANLLALWNRCDDFAKELEPYWRRLEQSS